MTQPTPPPSSPSTPPRRQPRDLGGLVFGLLLVGIGGYFLLTETLGIELPEIGQLWPVFVIGLGVWILLSAMRGDRR